MVVLEELRSVYNLVTQVKPTRIVSKLILVYNLIVDSGRYVDKLAPVAQSSVFKRRTVLALK